MTPADECLIDEVRERSGRAVSEAQLGRWRDHELMPGPIRTLQGRRGITSDAYPDGTVERVIDILDVLSISPKIPLDDVPMWLFILGREVSFGEFKASLNRAYTKMTADLPDDEDEGREDHLINGLAARFSTHLFGRFFAAFVSRKSHTADEALTRGRLVAMLVWRFLGRAADVEGERLLAEGLGLAADDVEDFRLGLAGLDLRSYRSTIDETDEAGVLAAARKGLWEVAEFASYLLPAWVVDRDPLEALKFGRKWLRLDAPTLTIFMYGISRAFNENPEFQPRLNEVLDVLRNGGDMSEALTQSD